MINHHPFILGPLLLLFAVFSVAAPGDAGTDQVPIKELDWRLFKNMVEGYASDGWGTRKTEYFSFTGEKQPSAYSYAKNPVDKNFVRWTTAKFPALLKGKRLAFAIPCGLGGEGGMVQDVPHKLLVNGKHRITIHSSVDDSTLWRRGEVWAFFKKIREDHWGDPFGILFLSLPSSEIDLGKPTEIKVVSEPQKGKNTVFFLITKYSHTIPYVNQAGGVNRVVMMSGPGAEVPERPSGSYCLTGNAPANEANRNMSLDGRYTYYDGMTDSYDFPYFEPHEEPGRKTNYDESMMVGGWVPFREGKITDGDKKTGVGVPAYRAGVRGTDYVFDLGKEFQIEQIELFSTFKGMRNISVYLKSEGDARWVLVRALSDRPRFVKNPLPKLAKLERVNVSGTARYVRVNVSFESYVSGLRELQIWGRPLKATAKPTKKIAYKQNNGKWQVRDPQELSMHTEELVIIPIPQRLKLAEGYFKLGADTVIYVLDSASARTRRTAEVLAEDIKDELRLSLAVRTAESEAKVPSGSIVFHPVGSAIVKELRPQGYQLTVDSDAIHIRGRGEIGTFYATQTLMQMPSLIRLDNGSYAYNVRACKITDWPVKVWRPVQGIPAPTKELLRALARFKTTDYAFGANRVSIDTALASNDFARDRFIKMIPSAWYILAGRKDPESHVERAPDEPLKNLGVGRRNPCPSHEGMWKNYFSTLDKLKGIYGDYINVGMDEMYSPQNGSRWNVCKLCRARNLTGHELMAETIRRIHDYLAKYDKKPMLIDSPLFIKGISHPDDISNDWRKAADLLSKWGISKNIGIYVWHVRTKGLGRHLSDCGFQLTHWSHLPVTKPIEEIYQGLWLSLSDGPFNPQYVPPHAQLCWSPNHALPGSEAMAARQQQSMARFRKIWTQSDLPGSRPGARFFTIDLKSAANRSFVDQVPFDGKGWADLGPNYDLRALKPGKREMAGVPFRIIDETENQGYGAVMVHNRRFMNRSLPTRVEIPVGRKAASINFLHTLDERPSQCYQVKRELVGYYFVVYDDGTYEPMEIKYAINISNYDGLNTWWDYAPRGETLKRGVLAWKGQLGTGNEAVLYRAEWVNPYPDRMINRMIFSATWKPLGVNPILIAATGVEPTQHDLANPQSARSLRGYAVGEVVRRVEDITIPEPKGRPIDLNQGKRESDYVWRTESGIVVEHNEPFSNRMTTRACDKFWTSAACAIFDNNQWTRAYNPILTITLPEVRPLTGVWLTCVYRFEDYVSDFQAKVAQYQVAVSEDGENWHSAAAKSFYIGEEEGPKWIPLYGGNFKAVRIRSTGISHVKLYEGDGPGWPQGGAYEKAAMWRNGVPHPGDVFGRGDVVLVPPSTLCESRSLPAARRISFKFLYKTPSFEQDQIIRFATEKSSRYQTILLNLKDGKLFNYVNLPVEGPQYVCEFSEKVWHDLALTSLDSKRYTLEVDGQTYTLKRRYDADKDTISYIKLEAARREYFLDGLEVVTAPLENQLDGLEVVPAPSENQLTETNNKVFGKATLKNPQLLEMDKRDGTPLGWDTILLRKKDGTWLKSADAMKIITVSKDEVILFRHQPTTRIEFVQGNYNMWIFGQKLLASELRGKTLRVKFHALRTAGAEQRSGYDIILRLRAWEKGTLVQTADATASCLKNIWTEASFELKVNLEVDQMDIQAFGPKQNTLNVSEFLVEVEQD